MTRSFGDFYLKQNSELSEEEQAVTALPEVRVHARNSNDRFLVLACDGIWDVMSNQQTVDFIGSSLGINNNNNNINSTVNETITTERVAEVCDDLLAECLTRGSGDNMSVIVIVLGTPLPPQPGIVLTEEETVAGEVESKLTTG
jgi:protein phosphatase 2C family protein 2/3